MVYIYMSMLWTKFVPAPFIPIINSNFQLGCLASSESPFLTDVSWVCNSANFLCQKSWCNVKKHWSSRSAFPSFLLITMTTIFLSIKKMMTKNQCQMSGKWWIDDWLACTSKSLWHEKRGTNYNIFMWNEGFLTHLMFLFEFFSNKMK